MHFAGSYAALVTPWNKNLSDIDFGALRELLDWHAASGTAGIVPAGTTGESATLTHKEQEKLISEAVRLAAGRMKVVAGAGSNRTDEALSLAKHAKAVGADGILVITPYYNRPTPEGLFRHFGAIAENCDLPMMMYNVPSRTGTNMLPDTVARIAKAYPHVVSLKEASGSVDQTCQIVADLGDAFEVVSGDDSLTVPLMAVGARGVVSVVANIVPAEMKKMVDAALARDWHYRLFPLMKACFVETNPAPVKTALEMMGRIDARMRLPMVEPKPESKRAVMDALRKAGVVP